MSTTTVQHTVKIVPYRGRHQENGRSIPSSHALMVDDRRVAIIYCVERYHWRVRWTCATTGPHRSPGLSYTDAREWARIWAPTIAAEATEIPPWRGGYTECAG